MPVRRFAVLPLAVAALLGPPAAADSVPPSASRPFVVPQRDVDVLYAIPTPNDGPPLAQRMRFAASARLQRVDPPGDGLWTVTDYAARTMTVVQPARRLATIIPAPGTPLSPDGRAVGGSWSRGGGATVAGLSCTDWRTADASGNASTVCFTVDGVLLRAEQDGRVILQARTVSEAPQPATVFAVPQGFGLRRAPTPPPPS